MGFFSRKEDKPKGKSIKLCNLAPNGLEIDIFTLTEVPNADNSGLDWEIMYKQMDFLNEELIGWADTTLGRVRFAGNSTYLSSGGMKLLAKWLEENQTTDESKDEIRDAVAKIMKNVT